MPEPAKIVNVDDNEPARYAKTRILSSAGFIVFDAASAHEGLEIVSAREPDLVLLDVNLPDANGIDICRRIKSSPHSAAVMVLQISATSTAAPTASAALNSGADAYLTEPVDPDVLIATVRALLRLRSAERALAAANESLSSLNRDLKRSNEDLQQFAFVASHDLKEPLRTVTSFVGLLDRSARDKLDETERKYLEYIVDGAGRMRALIDDLLTYSQAGQELANADPVDLGEALNWALENLRERIEESGAEVKWDSLPVVTGDATQLGHVMQNLISNAIKYQPPGQRAVIRLTAQQQGQREWLISVCDNGIGIETRFHETIFAPFKRLHGREFPGTGIGLAVCRKIIEGHDGRIWVQSTPGQGSRFIFTLRTAAAAGAHAQ